MGDSVIPVIFGGFFTILGVIIGWGLNEVSAIRRAKPKLCFKLNSTPDSELVEAELRTKTSASEYSIDIYNVGQSPVIIESFDMCWRKQLLIQCFPSSEDATVLPYHNISYVPCSAPERVRLLPVASKQGQAQQPSASCGKGQKDSRRASDYIDILPKWRIPSMPT